MNAKKRETTGAAAAPSLTANEREMARAASELA